MNVPPICEHVDKIPAQMKHGDEFPCGAKAEWHVIDKTDGTQHSYCVRHVGEHLTPGHTYSIFPERDYSTRSVK